jgi:GNAT superfamily N-acetyltransferase
MMRFRRAQPRDAAMLAELGRDTFVETFASQNRAEDIEAYVGRTYGEAQQRRELEDPSTITLIGEDDGVAIAYATLRFGEAPACVASDRPLEIGRFYVASAFHGRGIAQEMMHVVLDTAREEGATAVWLGVWEKNARAIAFYRKCRFREVGSHPFLLGTDLQTDLVMLRE